MKKKILGIVSLALVIAVVLGSFVYPKLSHAGNSEPAQDAAEAIRYKIVIKSDYFASRYVTGVTLRYGVNGSDETKDVDMQVNAYDVKCGVPQVYNYEAVVNVNKGDTIDYTYNVQSSQYDTWHDNDGKKFHVVANESNVKTVKYRIAWQPESKGMTLNGDVVLHYSINGWDNVQDVPMDFDYKFTSGGKTYSWYEKFITVTEGDTINYCFKANTTDGEKWDNNDSKDYSAVVFFSNTNEE